MLEISCKSHKTYRFAQVIKCLRNKNGARSHSFNFSLFGQAHSCVEKAGLVGLIRIRELDTDSNFSLRGDTLTKAIEDDRKQGLVPFYVSSTFMILLLTIFAI